MAEKRWIAETLFDDLGFRMSYQVDKVLYEMQTDDGAVLTIRNRVTIDPAAKPAPYIRSAVEVTAPEGPHAWLNRAVFVGTLHPLPPEKKAVVIRVYQVV